MKGFQGLMVRSDRDTTPEPAGRLQKFYLLRDRIAYALFLRQDLGLKLWVGLGFALSLFLFGLGISLPREAGENPGWRSLMPEPTSVCFVLTVVTTILGVNRSALGVFCLFFSMESLLLVYVPEFFVLGTLLLLGSLTIWGMVRPQRGGLGMMLLVPVLEPRFGLIALAPFGLACFYSAGKAMWMTSLIFVWTLIVGFWQGGLPRFGIQDLNIFPFEDRLTLTQLAHPPWSADIIQANLDRVRLFGDLLATRQEILSLFLCELFLAFLVIKIVRTKRRPVRYKDRLALEYLSREGDNVREEELVLFRQPVGVLMGLATWVSCQWLLAVWTGEPDLRYRIVGDLFSSCFVIVLVLLDYHGDPNMPLEYARNPYQPVVRKEPSSLSSSSFRIPTPSEMNLQYPSRTAPGAAGKDPGQIRLKTKRDRMGEAWPPPKREPGKPSPTQEKEKTPPLTGEPVRFERSGKIDNQYRIEEVLTGGMGVVYVVTDEFSGMRYAVKSLRDDLRSNEEAVARFATEARTWIRLGHHPNIVQAMFYREIEGRGLLFLEYVDGTDLEEVFGRPGPPPPMGTLVEWAIQVCAGMEYATTKDLGGGVIGLVHRDIKPGNIMLTREGRIKITDFGLAKAADAPTNLTREKVGLGTLKYMAPEQVKDAKHVDLRADIYSVGAVLYEGLVGHPPFTEEGSIDLYLAVLSKDPPRVKNLRPEIPDELDRIVMRCLQKDRDLRYASFEELSWALKRFQENFKNGGDSSQLRIVSH